MSWLLNEELLDKYYEEGLDEGLSPKEAEIYARDKFEAMS
jgi:hypothetical protein